jgi:hypothetical protein
VGRASAFKNFRFWNKKAPAIAGAFLCSFAGVFEGGFGNCGFLGGVFVLRLWWIRGGLWLVEGP